MRNIRVVVSRPYKANSQITVERPLRLNFHATPERLARLEDETAFKNLATSTKKDEAARLIDIAAGEQRQQQIRDLLAAFAKRHPEQINDRKVFLDCLKPVDRELSVRLSAPELKAVVSALSERDETAEICRNRDGEAEPDAELRDTENVPLKESIQAYFEREVLPHVPDAWIDHSKTKIGYEIPLNRHFYRYEPPRELAVIEGEIKALEADIVRLLGEVTA
jgi:type I restriction enzyme M protein